MSTRTLSRSSLRATRMGWFIADHPMALRDGCSGVNEATRLDAARLCLGLITRSHSPSAALQLRPATPRAALRCHVWALLVDFAGVAAPIGHATSRSGHEATWSRHRGTWQRSTPRRRRSSGLPLAAPPRRGAAHNRRACHRPSVRSCRRWTTRCQTSAEPTYRQN